jgi:PIN domain nuclease of toxin-antitoxin system
MLNLDTHVLLYAIHGRLNTGEQRILRRDQEWSVSAIVLWEIAKLHDKGRIPHGLDYDPIASAIRAITIWPITTEICLNMRSLDFQSDPADELIASTSFTHKLCLVTRDDRLRKSKVIRCV